MSLFLMRPTTENYEITFKTNFGSTKYPREKILDSRNTHEKIFWTHEIPTRKYFEPTKYPRENILDSRSTHEKKFWTHEILTKA